MDGRSFWVRTLDVERRGNSGRLPEGYGEDPLLNGVIGERVARGMQDQGVISVLKHFTAYNQETDRNTLDVHVSNRALHEVYNAPFYNAITQGTALAIMGSYPRVNGVYACENAALIDDLRAETGWRGFMMSDFFAGEDPVAGFNAGIDTTTLYPNFPREAFSDGRVSAERLDQAVRRTLYAVFAAGLFEHPVGALDHGKSVSTPEHKALARRTAEQSIVLLKNRNALLPLSRESTRTLAVIGCADRDVITGTEGSSYVIPGDYVTPRDAISAAAGEHIHVSFAQGSHGDHPLPIIPAAAFAELLGTFYGNTDFSGEPIAVQVTPTLDFGDPPVEGLPSAWSARWVGKLTSPVTAQVNFSVLCTGTVKLYVDGKLVIFGSRSTTHFIAGGYSYPLLGSAQMTANHPVDIVVEFNTPFFPLDAFMGKQFHLGWQTEQFIPEAVSAAQQADVAVVFVNQATGEGMDRDSFALPGDQNRLIEAICSENPNTIVVLNTPGAVLMPWIDEAAAVLQIWYPGEAIGTALASILFGDAEPAGRLPVIFPASEEQALRQYAGGGSIDLSEGVFIGYRHYQLHGFTPLYPFGYGLSYTQFEYTDLQITTPEDPLNAAVVHVTARNTGRCAGSTVVQTYIGALPAPVPTPSKQLAGFAKVTLKPGEMTHVEMTISRRVVSYWDNNARQWTSPKGDISVYVGSSAADDGLTRTLHL